MSVHILEISRIVKITLLCMVFCVIWACSHKKYTQYHTDKASALFEQGKINEEKGITDSAIYYYRATLDLIEGNDTSALRMEVYQQLGSLLFMHGYYDRSIKNYKEAYTISINLKDSLYSSFSLRKIGISQFFKNNLDSALFFFQQAQRFNKEGKNIEEYSSLSNNLAAVYTEKGNYQRALEWNNKAIATSKKEEMLVHNYAQRSNLCFLMNQIDSATHYSLLCISNPDPYIRASSLETLYMIKSLQGSADSIKYYTELNILNDSLWKANKAVEIAEAEFVFEQKKINELTQSKNQRLFLLLGLGFVLALVAIFAILKYKNGRKESKQEVHDTSDTDAVSVPDSTDKHELPAGQTNQGTPTMPEEEHQSLTIHNELLIKKGDMLAELFKNSLAYQKYSPLIIQEGSLSFQDQNKFLQAVEKTFDSFQTQLSDLCKLTKEESLLCCLFLLGFSNHECAICKNVTDNAIRTQKSRIKSKMSQDASYSELFEYIFKRK